MILSCLITKCLNLELKINTVVKMHASNTKQTKIIFLTESKFAKLLFDSLIQR